MSRAPRRVDMVGEVYGHLTVIAFAGWEREGALWYCKCDCGRVVTRRRYALISGKSDSCGHLRQQRCRESARARFTEEVSFA